MTEIRAVVRKRREQELESLAEEENQSPDETSYIIERVKKLVDQAQEVSEKAKKIADQCESPEEKQKLNYFQISHFPVRARSMATGGSGSNRNENEGRDNDEQPQVPKISLKYAMEVILIFDGHNIPYKDFEDGCNSAIKIISAENERYFVQVVRGRVQREARRAIMDLAFNSIGSDLVKVHQGKDEGIVAYTNRIKELTKNIREATGINELQNREQLTAIAEIEREAVKCLISG